MKTRTAEDIRRHAETALALDPALGLAHAALGRLEILSWRRTQADARLARARELSPNDPEVWQWSAFLAWLSSDLEAAVRHAERAIALDPENPASYAPMAMSRVARREHALVAAIAERYIALTQAAPLGYMQQARAALAVGDLDVVRSAVQALDRRFTPQAGRGFIADLAYVHGRIGERAEAQRLYDLIQTLASTSYVGPEVQAYASLAIGAHDAAVEHLEAALRRRAELPFGIEPFVLAFIRDNVWSDPALEAPRFVRLRERIGED